MNLLKMTILPIAAISIALPAQAATVKANKTVMATVNGKNITAADVTMRLWGDNGMKILNDLVVERVILDEAAKQKITASDEVVEQIYKSSLGNRTEEAANKDLAKLGWTSKDIRQRIKEQIIINETIIKLGNINITDEDVKNAYEASKAQLMTKETYNISQISVATRQEAEAVLDSLIKDRNANFADVSAVKSNIPELKAARGLIGDIERGKLPKEIEDEVFALRPGQISKIIQIGTNYAIFTVNNINPSRQLTLEEVQNSIRNVLINQQINARRASVINAILQKSSVSIK